jgi:hypothetical protein
MYLASSFELIEPESEVLVVPQADSSINPAKARETKMNFLFICSIYPSGKTFLIEKSDIALNCLALCHLIP